MCIPLFGLVVGAALVCIILFCIMDRCTSLYSLSLPYGKQQIIFYSNFIRLISIKRTDSASNNSFKNSLISLFIKLEMCVYYENYNLVIVWWGVYSANQSQLLSTTIISGL